ncbi:MAG: glycosyl transferase family 2 [Nitrospinae bacterium RIFCSPLOWO2_12_FULL_45_22]|nr:MAG: glycosyl transferase family 2 [Nitrospinae bacterium RIFCSPLOWO2_12_FULL_45_22]
MYKEYRITIVIPCLNEEEGIKKVLAEVPPLVDEVIVVDNNSTDRTGQVAQEMQAKVIFEQERGYGRAYKTGLFQAQGDIILTLDGDHSYPINAIANLLDSLIDQKIDFLSASRFPIKRKGAMSFKHYIGNKLLSLTMSLLYGQWIRDSQSGMWVFRKEVLSRMKLESNGMAFSEEIKIEAIINKDIKFKEVPIDYSQRAGEAKLKPWKDGFKNILFLFRKRFFR